MFKLFAIPAIGYVIPSRKAGVWQNVGYNTRTNEVADRARGWPGRVNYLDHEKIQKVCISQILGSR